MILPVTPVIPREFVGNSPTAVIPVELLLQVHNALDINHSMRTTIQDYIRAYSNANEKSHWTRAITVDAEGNLVLDSKLLDAAIYRGKQETRLKSATELFDKLRSEIELLVDAHAHEQQAIAALDNEQQALLPMRDYSTGLGYLATNVDLLEGTVNNMKSGLVNILVDQNKDPKKEGA